MNIAKGLKEKKAKLDKDIELLQHEEYALEERKKLSLLLIDLEGLTNNNTSYEEINKLVSKYDSEQIAARYIENLQEVKRKFKIDSEITKTNSTIAALVEEIKSDERKLIDQQEVYDKNKGVIGRLQSEIQDLENKISEKREVFAGKRSELDGIFL